MARFWLTMVVSLGVGKLPHLTVALSPPPPPPPPPQAMQHDLTLPKTHDLTTTALATNDPCYICFEGYQPAAVNGWTRDPTTQHKATCASLEARGLAGEFTSSQCQAIQTHAFFACECQPVLSSGTTAQGGSSVESQNLLDSSSGSSSTPLPTTTRSTKVSNVTSSGSSTISISNGGSSSSSSSSYNNNNLICYICFKGLVPTKLSNTALDPLTQSSATCGQLAANGLTGQYTLDQCQMIQTTAFFTCGCQEASSGSSGGGGSATGAPQATASPTPATTMTTTKSSTTLAPTPAGTMASTSSGTSSSSVMGTASSSTSSSSTGSSSNLRTATGTVTILLHDLPGLMPENTVASYQQQTAVFFTTYLATAHPPVTQITSKLLSQMIVVTGTGTGGGRRRERFLLRQPQQSYLHQRQLANGNVTLQTVLLVTGKRDVSGVSDLTVLLEDSVNANPAAFIASVQNATPPINQFFMESLSAVNALPGSAAQTVPPTNTPGGTSSTTNGTGTSSSSSGKSGLSGGAIAGTVIAVLFVVVCSIVGFYRMQQDSSGGRAKSKNDDDDDEQDGVDSDGDDDDDHDERKPMNKTAVASPTAVVDADVAAGARKGAKLSDLATDQPKKKHQHHHHHHQQQRDSHSSQPTPPQPAPVRPPAPAATAVAAASSRATPSDTASSRRPPVRATAPETIPLVSPSVPAPPPPPPRAVTPQAPPVLAATATSTTNEAPMAAPPVPAGVMSNQARPTHTIVAPPGKLGIVIDTTIDGPVVFKVNPGSPLEGHLFPGDIIIAIDGVETRAMSAMEITSLMVKTANQARNMLVIHEAPRV